MIADVDHHSFQANICWGSAMKSFAAFLPHIVTRWVRECFVEVGAGRFRAVANTTSTASERRRNSNTAQEGLQTKAFDILEKSICFRYGIGTDIGSSRGDIYDLQLALFRFVCFVAQGSLWAVMRIK